MLTCDICREEVMLEEDMKTHLLLSHLESDLRCPLCCRSAASYDELCFHVTSAHPEEPQRAQGPDHLTSGCSAPNAGGGDSKRPRTSGSTWDTDGEATPTCSSGRPTQTDTSDGRCSSRGPETRPESAGSCNEDRNETTSEQLRSSSRKGDANSPNLTSTVPVGPPLTRPVLPERLLSCPMCDLVCSSSFILQEHVELHLQDQGSDEGNHSDTPPAMSCTEHYVPSVCHTLLHRQSGGSNHTAQTSSTCPVREQRSVSTDHIQHVHGALSLFMTDVCSGSLQDTCSPAMTSAEASCLSGARSFKCPMCSSVCSDSSSLQEHVELHLDQGAAVDGAGSSDLRLATQLQQEEQRRRREEAQQEREEFRKLQKQFGLDGRGGYRRQMERTMERAVARGLLAPADFHCKRAELMESLSSGADDGGTRTQGVLRSLSDFYQTEVRDCVHVWLSADTDHYCSSGGDKGWGCGYRNLQMMLSSLQSLDAYTPVLQERTVPSIPRLQSMIEEAWKEGLDPHGASHFDQRLQGTRAWIGATEIYSLLTSLRIRARIMDFHQPTGPGDTHPCLFDWVKQYFCQSSRSSRLPPRLIQTSLPPLYLQHQGHSRSIVGLEQRKNGSLCLLLLDPGSSSSDTGKLLSRDTISTAIRQIRKFPRSLKNKQYQVVAAEGVLSADERQISILNSRTLRAERIP
ncbi:zinc finger-containing ubiquitin peptidase 1 isoform X1 [Embiotoca jacksoni]|uniref:zinc finger-containing ubiquitin peptidase 1 isoform X1 n=1 Tax=Embiotoca jacksoni TaxID=100190 RepID=UPI0037046F36